LRLLLPITAVLCWREQRRRWRLNEVRHDPRPFRFGSTSGIVGAEQHAFIEHDAARAARRQALPRRLKKLLRNGFN
jgi:hypothetical protein